VKPRRVYPAHRRGLQSDHGAPRADRGDEPTQAWSPRVGLRCCSSLPPPPSRPARRPGWMARCTGYCSSLRQRPAGCGGGRLRRVRRPLLRPSPLRDGL